MFGGPQPPILPVLCGALFKELRGDKMAGDLRTNRPLLGNSSSPSPAKWKRVFNIESLKQAVSGRPKRAYRILGVIALILLYVLLFVLFELF